MLYPTEVSVVGTNALAAVPTLIGTELASALTIRNSELFGVSSPGCSARAESFSVLAFPQRR